MMTIRMVIQQVEAILAAVPDVPANDDDRLSPQRRVAEARSPYGTTDRTR